VTTDYRTVLSEILRTHLGITNFSNVFPDFTSDRAGDFLNLLHV
jgi:hypothetical protein